MRLSAGWPVLDGRTFVLLQALSLLAAGSPYKIWDGNVRDAFNVQGVNAPRDLPSNHTLTTHTGDYTTTSSTILPPDSSSISVPTSSEEETTESSASSEPTTPSDSTTVGESTPSGEPTPTSETTDNETTSSSEPTTSSEPSESTPSGDPTPTSETTSSETTTSSEPTTVTEPDETTTPGETTPSSEPSETTSETSETSPEPSESSTEAGESSTETTESSTETTESSTETTESSTETTESSTETTESSTETTESSTETTESSTETTESPSETTPPPGEATITSTEIVDDDGNTATVPVIIGKDSEPITLDPVTTTATGEEAEATISEVQEQIMGLEDVIEEWKEDPEGNQEETETKVNEIQAGVLGAIGGLGAVASAPGVMNLAGIASQMGTVSSGVASGAAGVPGVSSAVSSITSSAGNLPGDGGKPDDGDGDGDGDEDGDDDEDDDDDEDQSSVSETASSTEASSSTEATSTGEETTTETPTETTEATSTKEETTTTADETTTETPTPTETPSDMEKYVCAPGNCGDSCAAKPTGPLSHTAEEGTVDCARLSTSTTDVLPSETTGDIGDPSTFIPPHQDPSDLPDPPEEDDLKRSVARGDWGGMDVFSGFGASDGLSARALQDVPGGDEGEMDRIAYQYHLANSARFINQGSPTSAEWQDFPNDGGSQIGVNGIYGCTSVFIISNKGAYVSHIWENPVFQSNYGQPTSDADFRQYGYKYLRDGSPHDFGATSLPYMSLIGTNQQPGVLHHSNKPKVFVMTPFTTPTDRQYLGIRTTYRFDERAKKLGRWVARDINAPDAVVVGYTRTDQPSSVGPGFVGKAILEQDSNQYWLTAKEDPAGLMGHQIGRYRLWSEHNIILQQDYRVQRSQQLQQKREEETKTRIPHPCQETPPPSSTTSDSTSTTDSDSATTTEETTSEEPTSTSATETTTTPEETTSEESTSASETETTTAPEETTTTSAEDTTASPEPTSTSAEPTSTEAATTTEESTSSFTYTEIPNEYGPTYVMVCAEGAVETKSGEEECNEPAATISTIEPERTGDTEKCRYEGHEASYKDCFIFCEEIGYETEVNLFIPAEDGESVWEGGEAGVPTWDEGPVQSHDYGEIGIQESIVYTWAYDTNSCSCLIDGEEVEGEYSEEKDYDDTHWFCTCDFDCHQT